MASTLINKLTIGLTGGIGSGKSVVANLFRQHGVAIIDADEIARKVVLPNTEGLIAIQAHFGSEFLNHGKLNRARLREYIFNHPQEKIWLENLLHPLIRNMMLAEINAATSPYCIVVIPLLIEKHPHPFIKRILVVDATKTDQLNRAIARDQSNEASIKKIIDSQATREQRLRLANDIITNNTDLHQLEQQVMALHDKYLKLQQHDSDHG